MWCSVGTVGGVQAFRIFVNLRRIYGPELLLEKILMQSAHPFSRTVTSW